MSVPSWPTWDLVPRQRRSRRAAGPRPHVVRLESRIVPATFTVNSLVDGVDAKPGDGIAATATGETTLRAAIMESNALGGTNTIVLPAGTYTLSLPGPGEDAAATGDLDILSPIVIQGSSAAATVIRGDGSD